VRAKGLLIEGSVSSGFEPVREAFIENFTRRGERGAGSVTERVTGDAALVVLRVNATRSSISPQLNEN